MRASVSIVNFGTAAIKLVSGLEKRFRLLSSWNLALSATHLSSSEDETIIPEESLVDIEAQELTTSTKCMQSDSIKHNSKSASSFEGIRDDYDIYHLGIQEDSSLVCENPQNTDMDVYGLGRMKVILRNRGWVLGSPDSCQRLPLAEYNIVCILNDLFEGSGDAALALAFFQWCEHYLHLQHGIRSTCVMIHILVAGNMNYRAIDLILYLVRKNAGEDWWPNLLLQVLLETYTIRTVLETVYSILIDCYIRANMVNVALKLACQMKHIKLFPSPGVCNSLLGALLYMDQFELAWNFLEEMQSQGLGLNVSVITLFIHKYCVKGNVERGWQLLVTMKQHGFSPDIVAYSTLIDSLSKMSLVREAISLLFKLSLIGISLDSISVSSVIDGLCKVGEVEKAFNILKIFRLPPNIYVYNGFISKYCHDSNMTAASSTFYEISEMGLVPDCFIYTTIISGYCKMKDLKMALIFLAKMVKSGVEPSVATYTTLIEYYCRSGEVHVAENLFQKMMTEGLPPDLVAYNTLMDGYGKEGLLHKVFGLLDIMKSAGVYPDNITYNTIIYSLTVRGFVNEAHDLLYELTRRGFTPDIVTFTNIASGYVKKGNFEEAFFVWHYMSEHNLEPDVVMCSALLNGYCRTRRMAEANALFTKMIDIGLVPDLVLYNTLIHGFCSVGNLDDACNLVEWMFKQGISPDEGTHQALILGYEKKMVENPVEAAGFMLQRISLK
nr:pentatricopeptide repeat-containing protein At2g19280-like [Coffea arabica]XP_027086851.1 pentatricopeptide repeat-containing protein At2g19280-like [Coffea arabica]